MGNELKVGRMYQCFANMLPLFDNFTSEAPIGYIHKNDVVIFLGITNHGHEIKVLTPNSLVGVVPYFPNRNHWKEYKG